MARNTNGRGHSLKDELCNRALVTRLAGELAEAVPTFDKAAFVRAVMAKLPTLELKARLAHVAHSLEQQLDPDFSVAAKQIIAALPPPLCSTKTDNDFGDFIYAAYGVYVARNGATAQHCQTALRTLRELTKRFSMEDAIRTYLNAFPDETYATLASWATDENYHVRRLVSEGTRPLLPWSSRLSNDPRRALPLLDKLQADPTRYVTRSVANHLNDLSKAEPPLVLATLARWRKLTTQTKKERAWLERHALRTLVKSGDPTALRFLGYRVKPAIMVFATAPTRRRLRVGETLTFSCAITASRLEPLVVNYVIDFVKANGQTAPKVFKVKNCVVSKRETLTLTKQHHFPKNASTFTYYPGAHKLTLQINGTPRASFSFTLLK